jgi:hypothetical protein
MLLCSGDEDAAVAQAPEDPEDALPWVTSLKHGSYDQLDLADRLEALLARCTGGGAGAAEEAAPGGCKGVVQESRGINPSTRVQGQSLNNPVRTLHHDVFLLTWLVTERL